MKCRAVLQALPFRYTELPHADCSDTTDIGENRFFEQSRLRNRRRERPDRIPSSPAKRLARDMSEKFHFRPETTLAENSGNFDR